MQWEAVSKDNVRFTIASAPQKDRDPLYILKAHVDGSKHQVCQLRLDAYDTAEKSLNKFVRLAEKLCAGDLAEDMIYKARDNMLKEDLKIVGSRKRPPATSTDSATASASTSTVALEKNEQVRARARPANKKAKADKSSADPSDEVVTGTPTRVDDEAGNNEDKDDNDDRPSPKHVLSQFLSMDLEEPACAFLF